MFIRCFRCEGLAEIIWINLTKVKEASRIARSISHIGPDMTVILSNLFDLNKKFTEHLTTIVLKYVVFPLRINFVHLNSDMIFDLIHYIDLQYFYTWEATTASYEDKY